MAEYTVLAEWLDRNQHRVFPLEDSMTGEDATGSFTIPMSFLADIFLCVAPDTDITAYYIKSIIVRRYTIDVEIGYDGDDEALTVGWFTKITHDQAINSSYNFEPSDQLVEDNKVFTIMSGVLIVGSVEAILTFPGQWSFTSDKTSLLSTRVTTGLAGVTSVMLGSDIYKGKIALKEGSGVRLTPSYDADNNRTIITISADVGNLTDVDIPLTNDASILANLTALYGTPIVNINGVPPDSDGNFTLQPIDCTTLTSIGTGLSIENPCSLPCCDKSVLDDAYTSIAELNLRYARMEGYYQSIGRNVNELQSRMIALEL
jgi:hypothetical protein